MRIIAVAVLAAFVLLALSFGPLVRMLAVRKAAARGLELSIASVRPGWLSVHLEGANLTLEGAPALRATFDHIQVAVTPWLSPRAVGVEGGRITLEGSASSVREQLEGWRARRRSGAASGAGAGGAGGLDLSARDIDIEWRGGEADDAPQILSGVFFERRGGSARAGFATARVASRWGAVTLTDASADFRSGETGLALEAARVAQVLGQLRLAEESASAEAASEVVDAAAAPTRAASDLDALDEELDPDGAEAAEGSAQPGSAPRRTLADRLAPLAAQSWPRRREQLAVFRELLGARTTEDARLDIARVQLEISHGASLLNVGPAPLSVRRADDVISASFVPSAQHGQKQLALDARLPLAEAPIEVSLAGGPISLQTLGVREGDFGLLDVDESALSLETRIVLSPTGSLGVTASGRLERLALEQPALAPEPLRDVDLNWSGSIALDMGQRKFAIERAELGLENVRLRLSGSVEAVQDDLRVGLNVELPKTSCQHLLKAAPAALLPQLDGLRLGGTLALHSSVAFDTRDPKSAAVEWELQNRCKVLQTPEEVDPQRFREPFQHYVMDGEDRYTEFTTGPTTPEWVPLSEITPALETGLIVCEDSRFFKHSGFDNKAIRDSILSNLRAGHFVRGASTLSMQLAKNLYLGREKTLSRKLQEAAFTLLLEQRLSKEDIIELYLNVVEFGPGIYGIRNAAQHYFNSHPAELSLAQAMYLASILPNPKAKRFKEDGTLKPRWAKHLKYLMRVAHKIKRIGDDELEAGMQEELVFGQAHPQSSSDFLFGTPIYDLNGG